MTIEQVSKETFSMVANAVLTNCDWEYHKCSQDICFPAKYLQYRYSCHISGSGRLSKVALLYRQLEGQQLLRPHIQVGLGVYDAKAVQ